MYVWSSAATPASCVEVPAPTPMDMWAFLRAPTLLEARLWSPRGPSPRVVLLG
ncbi:hypothetical protein RHMOL_Rhmol03G0148000 [Rhododendron molle]|uniref:Uncharacterized protein n=1 Tax=Rhododendron molle TaxID=49168 RepID=A0ACC0PE11_RHOML|nr:hypothetical protein RHMOL_Rhmol03G0148000 [Rhododendron molle]